MAAPEESKKKRILRRLAALELERQTWIPHWQDCSDYLLPRRGRFLTTESNKGSKRNDKIINSKAPVSARTLAAGLMALTSSPARPWFRLTTPDPELADFGSVKQWLHTVEERMRQAFARSNLYLALHTLYEDLLVFGTAAMVMEDDMRKTLRCYVLPVGEYCVVQNASLEVDGVIRKFSKTVAQVVEQFGLKACSQGVQERYTRGELDTWVELVHALLPNDGYTYGRADARGKRFSSCWLESAASAVDEKLLRESGYEESPLMCPRWHVQGTDIYGRSPGMDALGDARAIQVLEKRAAQIVEKIANPSMKAPASLQHRSHSTLPGGITYVDSTAGGATYEPSYIVNPNALPAVEEKIRQHEARIEDALFARLLTLLSTGGNGQRTATEIEEIVAEKKIQLGPVLERLNTELYDPMIDRAFMLLLRRGFIPPPPPELQNVELKVEYTSMLAQAQRALETVGLERVVGLTAQLWSIAPQVVDKLNVDRLLEEYASQNGVKPDLLLPQDQVDAMRQQRAQQAQQAQAMEQAQAMAGSARDLSQTPMDGDTGLTRLLGSLGGGGAGMPSAGGLQ